jgi:uncharacterized repeat protein (TIGR01451 family)
MKNTPNLYNTLTQIFGQHKHWLDKRHFQTLAWIVIGLIESGLISLAAWAPFVDSQATFAQSTVRRFRRWLENDRINVHALYGPVIAEALCEWGENKLFLALDTSMLWDHYCIIRISVIYRGRAIPLVWSVIEHESSSVTFETYRDLLDKALTLIPFTSEVVFLADRGFADTALMAHVRQTLSWHWRIRLKSSFIVYRPGKRRVKIGRVSLKRGEARFWHNVGIAITASPNPVDVGQNVTWVQTVTNHGPGTANGVATVMPLPTNLTFVSASASGWTCNYNNSNRQITCSRGSAMTNGQSDPISIVATVPGNYIPNNFSVAAMVSSTSPVDPNPANNQASVTTNVRKIADMRVVNTAAAQVDVGQNITWTLAVTNLGPSIANSVIVTDTLPTGVKLPESYDTIWLFLHV